MRSDGTGFLFVPRGLTNDLVEEFFDVSFTVAIDNIFDRSFGQDLSVAHDRDTVVKPLDLCHDVRRKNDALALIG